MERPEVVDRLVILNAPHPRVLSEALSRPRQLLKSAYIFFFQLPWVPELVLSTADFAVVRTLLERGSVHPDAFTPEDIERYVDALKVPGALTAALQYYRALPLLG